jgi:hypothetical protein
MVDGIPNGGYARQTDGGLLFRTPNGRHGEISPPHADLITENPDGTITVTGPIHLLKRPVSHRELHAYTACPGCPKQAMQAALKKGETFDANVDGWVGYLQQGTWREHGVEHTHS